jgi:hypothetical protein
MLAGLSLVIASVLATHVTSLRISDPRKSTELAGTEALGVKIGGLVKC